MTEKGVFINRNAFFCYKTLFLQLFYIDKLTIVKLCYILKIC